MSVAAGVLGLLYGVLHGAAARAEHERAIPSWASSAWLALAGLTLVAAVLVLFTHTLTAVVLLAVGVLGIAGLAVANGYWLHGRPRWSHHVMRLGFAAAVLVPAVLSLD